MIHHSKQWAISMHKETLQSALCRNNWTERVLKGLLRYSTTGQPPEPIPSNGGSLPSPVGGAVAQVWIKETL